MCHRFKATEIPKELPGHAAEFESSQRKKTKQNKTVDVLINWDFGVTYLCIAYLIINNIEKEFKTRIHNELLYNSIGKQ